MGSFLALVSPLGPVWWWGPQIQCAWNKGEESVGLDRQGGDAHVVALAPCYKIVLSHLVKSCVSVTLLQVYICEFLA